MLIVGCGYLGSALARRFRERGSVAVTTRSEERQPSLLEIADSVHLLKSPEDLIEIAIRYDTILFTVGADSGAHYRQAYLQNGEYLAEALKRSSRKKQLIYTSSTSVYGDHDGEWVDEESPLKGENAQTQILRETENLLLSSATYGHSIAIFRLGGIVGPGREVADRLKRLAGSALPGDGESYVNLSPLEKIVDAIELALDRKLEGIYNLCSDHHPKRKDFYDEICRERGLPPVSWDATKESVHGGNKRVSSEKFRRAVLFSKPLPY